MKIVLTAGFDKAKNAIGIAELLRREGITVSDILVVSPFNFKRLNAYIKQRGIGFIFKAAKRLTGSEKITYKDAVTELFQDKSISDSSLKTWAQKHKVPYHSVTSLNEEDSLNIIKNAKPDWLVYAGGGKILNAHAGPLPEIRGMNACEWSLLTGLEPNVTVHLINRGIDTGGIIKRYPVAVEQGDGIERLRSKTTAIGINALVETVLNPPETLAEASKIISRQCFVLAPALKEKLEQRTDSRFCIVVKLNFHLKSDA